MSHTQDIPRIIEASISLIPTDATGLLIVKWKSDEPVTPEQVRELQQGTVYSAQKAGLSLRVVVLTTSKYDDISFELLTNDQLKAIGFQRVPQTNKTTSPQETSA